MRGRRQLTGSDDLNAGVEPLNAAVQDAASGFLPDEEPEGHEEGHDRLKTRLNEKEIPRETVIRRTGLSTAAE